MNIIIFPSTNNNTFNIFITPPENINLEEIFIKDIGNSIYKVIDDSELPDDCLFRDAWEYDFSSNSSIYINMNKAREIWKNIIRVNRVSFLEKLDIEYLRSLEKNDIISCTNIAQRKQILRDCTKDSRINNAQTTSDLKTIYNVEELSQV